MGCRGSSTPGHRPEPKLDVFVTCTNTLLEKEDFAGFFGEWILKLCEGLKLSAQSGRPRLGAEEPRPGSREFNKLHSVLLASRAVVCIVNLSKTAWPPPGYEFEVTWAEQAKLPVVAFYDADRFSWKEVCTWKIDMPGLFRSDLGPVRYHRNIHKQAKEHLENAIKRAVLEIDDRKYGNEAESALSGPALGKSMMELSLAERRLMLAKQQRTPEEAREVQQDKDGFDDDTIGLQRKDFEDAGLIEKRLERTNSLKDITVEVALTMLRKRPGVTDRRSSAVQITEGLLAARETGCRLQFLPGFEEKDVVRPANGSLHQFVKPAHGILKKKGDKKRTPVVSSLPDTKRLRLSMNQGDSHDRRVQFAIQTLQKHLQSLRPDDVHELATVLKCLQDGEDDRILVMRALHLLSVFMENHLSLHTRAISQGAITGIVDAMKKHVEIDVFVHGGACLRTLLEGAQKASDGSGEQAEENRALDCINAIVKCGGIEVIADGMRRFPTCEMLQASGCKCFALLTYGRDGNRVESWTKGQKGQKVENSVMLCGRTRRLITRHGGLDILLTAMRRFVMNTDLQASCCIAIGQLGNNEIKVKKKAASADGGIVGLVLGAMSRHAKDVEVQRAGCSAIKHLSANHDKVKGFIASQGGVDRLCAAAKRYARLDSKVYAEALGALCHLASKHPENKERIFRSGALELTLDTFRGSALDADGNAEVSIVEELASLPEANVAMAGCGLLHNLACNDTIKRHIVKLGGREIAGRLEKHEAASVRNLARVVIRTLSPPSEAEAKDPFGSIFAVRAPTTTGGTNRVVSKRGKKNAQEALRTAGNVVAENGVTPLVRNVVLPDRTPPTRAADEDAASDGGGSEKSIGSSSSAYSASRGGSYRSSGRGRQGARRFAKAWDGNTSETATTTGGPSTNTTQTTQSDRAADDWTFLETVSSRAAEEDDDARSVTSATSARSEYSARSYLSLEGNSQLIEDMDLASAISALGFVKIRGEGAELLQDRRKRMKRRPGAMQSEPRAQVVQRECVPSLRSNPSDVVADVKSEELAIADTLSQGSKTSSRSKTSLVSGGSTGTFLKPATEGRPGLAERLKMSVTHLEQVATKKMGQTQGALLRAPDAAREHAREQVKKAGERVGSVANSETATRGSAAASHKTAGTRGRVK